MNIVILGLILFVLILGVPSANAVITNPPVIVTTALNISFDDWGFDEQHEGVVVVNGTAYIIWEEAFGGGDLLKFSKSTDGTWSAPITVIPDNDENILDFYLNVKNSDVDIFYTKRTGTASVQDYNHTRSTDGGTTFNTPVRIDQTATGVGSYIDVDVVDDTIVTTWKDVTDSHKLFFSRSTDGGTTFSTPLLISDGTGGAGNSTQTSSQRPDIQQSADGTNITIAYGGTDAINGDKDLWESHSTDSGTTFTVPLIITPTDGSFGGYPKIFRSGSDVVIIREADNTILQLKSTDDGVTYGAETTVVSSSVCDPLANFAPTQIEQDPLDLDKIHLVCINPTDQDVLYQRTLDFGDTWSTAVSIANDPLDISRGGNDGTVDLAVNGLEIFVTWVTTLSSSQEGETLQTLVRSIDGGTTFNLQEFFIDTNLGNYGLPVMKTDGDLLFLLLENQPSATSSIESFFEDLDSPASPILPIFNGSATQVSVFGGVSNVDSYSTDEKVYWIWEEQKNSELVFSFSSNGETNTPIILFAPNTGYTLSGIGKSSIYADGDDVYVMYRTGNAGGGAGDRDINLKISNNGGATFGSEIKVEENGSSTLIGDDGKENQMMLKSDDGDLYIFTSDTSVGVTYNMQIHKSANGGATWVLQGELDGFDLDTGSEPFNPEWNRDGIIIDGDIIHVSANAIRSGFGEQNFWYARSTNEGVDWSTPVNIGLDTGEGDDETPIIIKDNDDLLIVMFDHEEDDMNFNTSDDNGVTWCATEDYCGTVNTDIAGCSSSNGSWDWAKLPDSRTVVVMCGGFGTDVGLMTISTDMGKNNTWSAVTEVGLGSGGRTEIFSADYSDSNMAFSWFFTNSTENVFQISEVRASLPIDEVSDFSSVTTHYDEEFDIFGFGTETTFREPSVHVADQGLWVSWVGQVFSGQTQDLFFVFENFPNGDLILPVITLLGGAVVLIDIGDTYSDDGATAFDNQDGDVTSDIVIVGVGDVDTSVEAVFSITYNVDDSDGNSALEVTRSVVVVQPTSGGGGGGIGQGSSVGSPEPTVSDLDIEDLDSNQIQDLLDMLAPVLQTTIVQEIIQTFFEFQVIDKEHKDIVIQSFLTNEQLGIRWSTGDDIVITSVVPANSPFTFTFEQVPIIKQGSGSAISENAISYSLQVPSEQCGEVFSFDCVDTIRYSVPVTVNALINGTQVNAVGTILVDLTTEDINPVLVILFFTILIPIVAGIIWKIRGGHNPSKVSDLLK